jgi:hypothetical protein
MMFDCRYANSRIAPLTVERVSKRPAEVTPDLPRPSPTSILDFDRHHNRPPDPRL